MKIVIDTKSCNKDKIENLILYLHKNLFKFEENLDQVKKEKGGNK